MNRNVRTRASLLASWYAAQKIAGANGAVILNHASAAGMLLDQHDGNVQIAIEKCPTDPWWIRVLESLVEVSKEDCEDVVARASQVAR